MWCRQPLDRDQTMSGYSLHKHPRRMDRWQPCHTVGSSLSPAQPGHTQVPSCHHSNQNLTQDTHRSAKLSSQQPKLNSGHTQVPSCHHSNQNLTQDTHRSAKLSSQQPKLNSGHTQKCQAVITATKTELRTHTEVPSCHHSNQSLTHF